MIAASIISGGKSTRMNGQIKGNLGLEHGITILQKLIETIRDCKITEIIISANESKPYVQYNLPIVADSYKNIGPLAGIDSSLNYYNTKSNAVLILPSDVPNITSDDIKMLITEYNKCKTIAYSDRQPLFAIINVNQLPMIQQAIKSGSRKVREVWQKLNAKAVVFKKEFININTESDYANFTEYSGAR